MAAPRKIDYERIEPGWRAGLKSPAQLAAEYTEETGVSVSHVAISKHFKKQDVPRDLSAKIRAKADAIVAASMVSGKVEPETKKRANQIVDDGAAVVATIRLSHRTDIQRSKRIANKLLEQLELLSLPDALPAGATPEQVQLHRALIAETLKAHAAVLKQLVDTQRVVVGLEREAFGIAQMVENTPDGSPELTPERVAEGARRMAFVLHRAALLMKG